MLDDQLLHDLRSFFFPETIAAVSTIPRNVSAIDSPTAYSLETTRGDYILIVSSDVSPQLVARGSNLQKQAKLRLHAGVEDPIELAVYEGAASGRSYAVWPRRQPLRLDRVWSKIERLRIAPRVYRWLRDLTSQTVCPSNEVTQIANLERLQHVSGLARPIKIEALKAAEAFRKAHIPPMAVVQHSDLHLGNILRAPTSRCFIVIDWAGARVDGSPYFDLVKFSLSLGASKYRLRKEIEAHSKLLNCEGSCAMPYVLSGLGALHSQLEYFPKARFLVLCERKFSAIQAAIA